MQKKVLIILLLLVTLITIGNSIIILVNYKQEEKTVVIDIMRTVNEFNLKKDMENRVASRLNDYTKQLDSLQGVYKIMVSAQVSQEQITQVKISYDTLESRAQRAYTNSNKQINETIWKRLNSLLTEYGEQHKYQLVIGANGMGTVLYNRKGLDKTDELITFINSRYKNSH